MSRAAALRAMTGGICRYRIGVWNSSVCVP